MASKAPNIRELALAALARQHGTVPGTVAGQDVPQPANVHNPSGTVFVESDQELNSTVPLSRPLGRGTVGHPEKSRDSAWDSRGTPCAHCGRPGGLPVAYVDVLAVVHPGCRNAWRAAQDAIFDQRLRLVAGSSV
jgi:hypothetical protein